MESLFAVGNGYLGLRDAPDPPPPGAQPDLFVDGIFDRKSADLPYSELKFLAPERDDYRDTELVPLPFALRLGLWVDGEVLDLTRPHGDLLRRTLDLRAGVLRIKAVGGRARAGAAPRCARAAVPALGMAQLVVVVAVLGSVRSRAPSAHVLDAAQVRMARRQLRLCQRRFQPKLGPVVLAHNHSLCSSRCGRTRAASTAPRIHKPVVGEAAKALRAWLDVAQITSGRIFRQIGGISMGLLAPAGLQIRQLTFTAC